MISYALYFSLWAGTSSLAWAYGLHGFAAIAGGLIAFGMVWTLSILRRWTWYTDAALILVTLAAAAGIYLALPFGWMLAGILGALLTYDLSNFSHRLYASAQEQDSRLLEQAHLSRLGMFLIFAISFSSAAVLWQTQISFEWMVIFVLVVVWGLSRLLCWLRQEKHNH